jgi:nucleoid-associated protein YgaU
MSTFSDDKKADFSDVQGGSSTTDPVFPPPHVTRTYTVVKGDSLSRIAKQFYGKAGEWHRIYEANKSIIKDPDLIYPGQVFTIPE